jgi:hypothetical protein
MKSAKNLKRTRARNFSAHHLLIRTALLAIGRAKKREAGWHSDALTAMTFSALAIEALCNSIGAHVYDDWDDFENSSLNAKLRLVASRLGLTYVKGEEPWSTARWLVKFRNLVAHAKPQLIVEEELITPEKHDQRLFEPPPTAKLEKWISLQNADRAVLGAEAIEEMLIRRLKPMYPLGLATDGWNTSTQPETP